MAIEVPLRTAAAAPSPPSLFGGFALAAAGSLAVGLVTALFRPQRNIGPMVAQVTIEETGRDDLETTRHPVELGAAITDHAYKLPNEITIRCGWSDSGALPGYSAAVYSAMLDLQYSRIPMTVTTGKRTYVNMLIVGVQQSTNAATENGLVLTILCRQIIIVQSKTATIAPKEAQATPAATDATKTTGPGNPVAVTNTSVLDKVTTLGTSISTGIKSMIGF